MNSLIFIFLIIIENEFSSNSIGQQAKMLHWSNFMWRVVLENGYLQQVKQKMVLEKWVFTTSETKDGNQIARL